MLILPPLHVKMNDTVDITVHKHITNVLLITSSLHNAHLTSEIKKQLVVTKTTAFPQKSDLGRFYML